MQRIENFFEKFPDKVGGIQNMLTGTRTFSNREVSQISNLVFGEPIERLAAMRMLYVFAAIVAMFVLVLSADASPQYNVPNGDFEESFSIPSYPWTGSAGEWGYIGYGSISSGNTALSTTTADHQHGSQCLNLSVKQKISPGTSRTTAYCLNHYSGGATVSFYYYGVPDIYEGYWAKYGYVDDSGTFTAVGDMIYYISWAYQEYTIPEGSYRIAFQVGYSGTGFCSTTYRIDNVKCSLVSPPSTPTPIPTATPLPTPTPIPTPSGLDDGLIAHYPFDGHIRDTSGRGNDGTASGTVLCRDRNDYLNNAMRFDGVDDYFEVPDSMDFHVQRLSIAAWIRSDDWHSLQTVLGKDDFLRGYQLVVGDSGAAWMGIAANGEWYTAKAACFPPKQWKYVVGTYDGQYVRIFVDGVERERSAYTGSISYGSRAIQIGRNGWNLNAYLDGDLDDLRIYNRALSADEIWQLYSGNYQKDNLTVSQARDQTALKPEANTSGNGTFKCSGAGGSPIAVRSGDYRTRADDAVLGTRGLPLQITRFYNSIDEYDGPFSHGWCFNQTVQLMRTVDEVGNETAIVRWANGVRKDFTLTNGIYQAPLSCYDTLSSNGVGYLLEMPSGMQLQFNQGGFLVSQTDRNGNAVTYEHDLQNRISRVTSADGRTLDYRYNETVNRVGEVEDWSGRIWSYEYSPNDDLVTVTYPDGAAMRYTYDADHNLIGTYDARSNLVSALTYDTDADKATSYAEGSAVSYSFSYDTESNTTYKVDSEGRPWSFRYNQYGNKENLINPAGQEVQFTWTGSQEISSQTDPRGYPQYIEYDQRGNVSAVSNSLGHVTRYTYETNYNQVTSITDPLGNLVTNVYDDHGNLVLTKSFGRPTFIARSFPASEAYTAGWTNGSGDDIGWAEGWDISLVTENAGAFISGEANVGLESCDTAFGLWANSGGNATATRTLSSSLATGNVLRFAFENEWIETGGSVGFELLNSDDTSLFKFYFVGGESYYKTEDSAGVRTSVISYTSSGLNVGFSLLDTNEYRMEAGGHVLTGLLSADSDQQVKKLRLWNSNAGAGENYNLYVGSISIDANDAEEWVSRFEYDSFGQLTNSIDARGNAVSMSYNSHGEMLDVTDPLANSVTYTYDDKGKRITMTDARGSTWYYGYDIMDRLVAVTNPLGEGATYTYDLNGNKTSVTDARSNTTWFAYDAYNRLASVSNALGHVTTYEYDIYGNQVAVRDALGNASSNAYDILNRITETTDPLGNVISFSYDENGNRTGVTDPLDNTASYAFDPLNRMISMTNAVGGVWEYAYDANHNLLSVTDARNNTSETQYDTRNIVTNSANALGYAFSYKHDGNGNVIQRTDPNGNTLAYSYDAANRLTNIVYPDGSMLVFSYDENGNVTELSNTTEAVRYAYDPLNRVTNVFVVGLNKTVSYEYDAVGNRSAMIDPDGGRTEYEYDALNRLTALSDPGSNTWTYAYDAINRMTNLTMPNGIVATYQYDVGSHLTNLVYRNSTNTILQSFAYTYDAVGNPLSVKREDNQYEIYQYDDIYQLTRVDYDATNAASASTNWTEYVYDLVGNRLTLTREGETETYEYDDANRLLSVTSASSVVTFGWDDNGNMTNTTDNGTNTWYDWDYDNKLVCITYHDGSTNVFSYYPSSSLRHTKVDSTGTNSFVYDGQNLLQELDGLGNLVAQYQYSLGIDSLLARTVSGNQQYYLRDMIGSVTAVADSDEDLLATYRYDAFGTVRRETGVANNPYLFTSRRLDQDSGLYYYRARYMGAGVGRFLSYDIAGQGNGFSYVGNSPLMLIDPSGHYGVQNMINYAIGGLEFGLSASGLIGDALVAGPVTAGAGIAYAVGLGLGDERIMQDSVATLYLAPSHAVGNVEGMFRGLQNVRANNPNMILLELLGVACAPDEYMGFEINGLGVSKNMAKDKYSSARMNEGMEGVYTVSKLLMSAFKGVGKGAAHGASGAEAANYWTQIKAGIAGDGGRISTFLQQSENLGFVQGGMIGAGKSAVKSVGKAELKDLLNGMK